MKLDYWIGEASRELNIVKEKLKSVNDIQERQRIDLMRNAREVIRDLGTFISVDGFNYKVNRDRERFYAWNPRQRRAVQGIFEPASLVSVYTHPRTFLRLEGVPKRFN